jgi:hypothetical protein
MVLLTTTFALSYKAGLLEEGRSKKWEYPFIIEPPSAIKIHLAISAESYSKFSECPTIVKELFEYEGMFLNGLHHVKIGPSETRRFGIQILDMNRAAWLKQRSGWPGEMCMIQRRDPPLE